ncbi:MAG: OadG family protein [Eubacteriales bacterium]|nr:OadG family protein [Eubacteriales bacterium]
MKLIFKKTASAGAALLLAMVMLLGSGSAAWAADEDMLRENMTMTAEGLAATIIQLSDEEIEAYASSGDAFTESAMSAWSGSKEELGARKEDQSKAGDTEISYANGEYTVTVPMAFEKVDADFVFVFDENGIPTSMGVDVKYSMGETLKRAGMNTVMGIGIVFLMLLFLSFVIYLFKFIPDPEKKKAAAKAAAPDPAPAAAVPAPAAEPEDDTELIAVIAAAIAAAEGTATDGFVVRSIRKINRKRR